MIFLAIFSPEFCLYAQQVDKLWFWFCSLLSFHQQEMNYFIIR